MKNCPEIEELLEECIGDNVAGFFSQEKADEVQGVSVFTLVRSASARKTLN